jgi:putative N6-adenine-specific DNA methylase
MRFIAKTLYGLEDVLAKELTSFNASNVKPANRAVIFNGNKELLYTVNYCSRTALSVLMQVAEFRIKSKDDLYKSGSEIEWDKYMSADNTFAITPVVNSSHFAHSGYAGLLLKDAIADYFRKVSGKRPSVNAEDPDILINLHISHDLVTISLDSSVIPLFKRGYRKEQAIAPLNEVLAAGMLLISGWDGTIPLIDPMCGSGTISIEAGMIAGRIPPGKFRKFFGFQKWKDFDQDLFDKIRNKYNSLAILPSVGIFASDISEKAATQARTNVIEAGLDQVVKVDVIDFKDVKSIDNQGVVFLNPPYGLRLQPEEIDSLYAMIGTSLKHNFPGYVAWLITSNRESVKHIGLRPKQKLILFNGALECTLLKYELYQGSKKQQVPGNA